MYCTVVYCITVEWNDCHSFAIFENKHIDADQNIFMSSIPKNRQIFPRAHVVHARKSFHFKKITETVRMNNLC